jgi:hypothetical protein
MTWLFGRSFDSRYKNDKSLAAEQITERVVRQHSVLKGKDVEDYDVFQDKTLRTEGRRQGRSKVEASDKFQNRGQAPHEALKYHFVNNPKQQLRQYAGVDR